MMMGRDGALGILIGAAVGTCSLLLVGCGSRPSRLPEEPVSTAYFTLGSSKDEVQRIMGTPSSIYASADWWSYGSDRVEFDSRGRVDSYSNLGGRLKLCG